MVPVWRYISRVTSPVFHLDCHLRPRPLQLPLQLPRLLYTAQQQLTTVHNAIMGSIDLPWIHNNPSIIFFTDFDGTITLEDSKQFLPGMRRRRTVVVDDHL